MRFQGTRRCIVKLGLQWKCLKIADYTSRVVPESKKKASRSYASEVGSMYGRF